MDVGEGEGGGGLGACIVVTVSFGGGLPLAGRFDSSYQGILFVYSY